VTRNVPENTEAPPVFAAVAPRTAKNTSDVPAIAGVKTLEGTK